MSILKDIFSTASSHSFAKDILSLAFLESPVASLIIDEQGRVVEINNAFHELTGYSRQELLGKQMSFLKSGEHDDDFYKELWDNILTVGKHDFEVYNRCKNKTTIVVHEKIRRITVNGINYFISTHENITEQKRLSDRNRYLATHDSLTGLANRTLLHDRLLHALSSAARTENKVVMIMCDLDEFKKINDDNGHNFGDKVLQEVANKLKSIVRESDTVVRYGGDEFIVIFEHLRTVDEAIQIVNEIKSYFPLFVTNKCSINMSIGYAVFPDDGTNIEQLSHVADSKMYDAKKLHYEH